MKNLIKIGSHVRYSKRFLQSIGVYTGEMPQKCGTVINIDEKFSGGGLVTVEWHGYMLDEDEKQSRVLACNLSIGRNFQCSIKKIQGLEV